MSKTDSACCSFCGTKWRFETSGGRNRGGMSGFIWSTIMSHVRQCEHWTPEERLKFIERNQKRLAKKSNLHTSVFFDLEHPGVVIGRRTKDALDTPSAASNVVAESNGVPVI